MLRVLWAAAVVGLVAGCGGKAVTQNTQPTRKETPDPWPKVAGQFRKDTDPATCRRVLDELSMALSGHPTADKPASLAADAIPALKAAHGLSDADVAEIQPPRFSPLDAHYLAECFYLRDAARTLEAAGRSPTDAAAAAFAWTCRQLDPDARSIDVSNDNRRVQFPPVPPTYALKRGSGSGVERAYVFLGLLRQLKLDAGLVGPPSGVPNRGPFWAVGVRDGADVKLFDPWRGVAVPGTLAQVKANPDLLKTWYDDKAYPLDKASVAASEVTVAVPLSALAPRLATLEAKIKDEAGVVLAADPGVAGRFEKEAKAKPTPVASAADPFTLSRVLAYFLPPADGGLDAAAAGNRLALYRASRIVPGQFPPPEAMRVADLQEAFARVQNAAAGAFHAAFVADPSPRERVQRGQFNEVVPALVQQRDRFESAKGRVRADRGRSAAIADWLAGLSGVYATLSTARLDEKTNPLAFAQAQQAVDEYWRKGGSVVDAVIESAVADIALAEATYLLATAKHEQAERLQARRDRGAADAKDKAHDAWADARDWWGRYAGVADGQAGLHPGRKAHAAGLAARAAEFAGR